MSGPTADKAVLGVPDRWMFCPKTGSIVDNLFFPFKVPLCGLYDDHIADKQHRFYPEDVFASPLLKGRKIGLWIDLTKTDRFYFVRDIESRGCKYKKIRMAGHGSSPSLAEIGEFIREVDAFIKSNPGQLIAIHCTHGFNRTGFAIASYLVTKKDYAVDYAVQLFAANRPCGIYKQEYLNDLFERFDVADDCLEAPLRPSWEFGEDVSLEPSTSEPRASHNTNKLQEGSKKFMDGLVPGVELVDDVSLALLLQAKIKGMCGATRDGFPGLQPVSMVKRSETNPGNLQLLEQNPYLVSWKADGMRYMVLIAGQDEVFAFDRDNAVFRIERLDFVHRKEERPIRETLVDAEMVIDEDKETGKKSPRLLIYDIIVYEGQPVGKMNYNIRRQCIKKELIDPRNKARAEGKMREQLFGVRIKDFWDLEALPKFFEPKFRKNLGHEMDGLIFQPVNPPYTVGRCDAVLKWKDPFNNSVDFKLKIKNHPAGLNDFRVAVDYREMRQGELPQWWAFLYVQHSTEPLAKLKALKTLQQYDDKIVECNFNWKTKEWQVMRERTDKSLPNAYNTAMNVWESIQHPITEKELVKYVFTRCLKKRPAQRPEQEAKRPKVQE